MSFQADLKSVLAGVSGGKFFFMVAPKTTIPPFVLYRVVNEFTLETLQGPEGAKRYIVEFNCIGSNGADAIAAKDEVESTLAADTTLIKFYEPREESSYIPDTDEFMEPLVMGFWHTA